MDERQRERKWTQARMGSHTDIDEVKGRIEEKKRKKLKVERKSS